jgi:hypothetical protein
MQVAVPECQESHLALEVEAVVEAAAIPTVALAGKVLVAIILDIQAMTENHWYPLDLLSLP